MIKRNTAQKKEILSYIRSVKSHPTAEAVYAEVSKALPSISLSTVYRNLNSLVDDGYLLRIEVGNEAHYDADVSFHHHVYCRCCRRIFDLFDEELSGTILRSIDPPDFEVESVTLLITGKCASCSGKSNDGYDDRHDDGYDDRHDGGYDDRHDGGYDDRHDGGSCRPEEDMSA